MLLGSSAKGFQRCLINSPFKCLPFLIAVTPQRSFFIINNNINNNNNTNHVIDHDNNNDINCQGVRGMDSKVSKDQCQLAYELELREIDLKAARKSIELFQDVQEERDELVEVVKDMSNEITRLKRELIGQERETERAKAIGKRVDESKSAMAEELRGLKVKKTDKLTVTVNAEHIKSELDNLYQDFQELEEENKLLKIEINSRKSERRGLIDRIKTFEAKKEDAEKEFQDLKQSYDQRVKELAEISGYIEGLAEYGYTDEEGHPLHNCMSFVRIADIVGAEIPKADVIHAKVKRSIVDDKPKKVAPFEVLSDKELFDGISNAKITELSADKITADAYKELAGEQEVKEYEVNVIADAGIKEAAIHPPIMDSDLKEKMVWVKELGVYILPKFV